MWQEPNCVFSLFAVFYTNIQLFYAKRVKYSKSVGNSGPNTTFTLLY